MFSRLRSFWQNLWKRAERDLDLNDEIHFHIEARTQDLIRNGLSREEAQRQGRLEFGALDKSKEACRESTRVNWLEDFLQDARFALRMLRKSPGFTVIAILTLALGIGASTAIFSVVNAVLLHPLAYKDSDRLVTLLHNGTDPVAAANYFDWRDQSRSFDAMGAADYWSANLTGIDSPEHILGLKVTQTLLPMLGVEPLLGRLFAEGEDEPGADHEVILSYALWQRRFGGDRNLLGKTIALDGEPYAIVGVMPREFHFAPFWATHSEMWVPNPLRERAHDRDGNSLRIFARLKPGVVLPQARAEIAGVTARLERQYPGTNRGVEVTPLKEQVVGKIETPLLVLLGAVGFVLLIACANVAHMLLARSAARQKEIAVRTALGAGRARVIRQFLTENLLLSITGGSAGLLLALWGTRALVALGPTDIPRVESVTVDARVVFFMLGVTVLTSVAFGLAPALQASSVNLSDTLKESGRGSSDGIRRNRLRSFLVASEFALALMLLIGAGLMIRSFSALQSVDPGFNPHNVLSMIVSVAGSKEFDPAPREIFYRQLLERVRTLPDVESAAGINHLPVGSDIWDWSFTIDGRSKPLPGDAPRAIYRIVTPGYFQTMRLPLIRGRDISAADAGAAPGVVIINEQAAREYWPGEDPLGKRVSFHESENHFPTWLTIIGIAKNAKQGDWTDPPFPEAYLAAFQTVDFLGGPDSHSSYITLVVHTSGDPAALAPALKNVVWSFDRNLAISDVTTMDGEIAHATAQPRFEMLLLGVFAFVALALAAVGIYGVMTYSVSRRTHEIGIRISLGASRTHVLLLVVRQGMILALAGSAVGIAGAIALSRLMAKLLYGVLPTDPITFVAVALLLMIVAFAASCIPARRAMRVDPMIALRHE
jgi:putative ABC transport system permease protein